MFMDEADGRRESFSLPKKQATGYPTWWRNSQVTGPEADMTLESLDRRRRSKLQSESLRIKTGHKGIFLLLPCFFIQLSRLFRERIKKVTA